MIEPEIPAFVECWNSGRFFEAHEVLEGLWVRTRDPGQRGLIGLAAALHHITRGNLRGARRTLDRALPRLHSGTAFIGPIDLEAVANYARALRSAIETGDGLADVEARPRF